MASAIWRRGRLLVFRALNAGNERTRLVGWLWVIALIYFEAVVFRTSIWSCEWPELPGNNQRRITEAQVVTHVLLVADPQLTDPYSYGHSGLVEYIVEFFCDSYMSKSFRLVQQYLKPQAVFFLGDLFDGGREWQDDTQWLIELKRFKRIFRPRLSRTDVPPLAIDVVFTPPETWGPPLPMVRQPNSPFLFYLAGNHDVGVGDLVILPARKRFVEHFGPTTYAVKLNDIVFVVLDTLDLRRSTTNTLSNVFYNLLLQELKEEDLEASVLMTHVPLWRPNQSPCGHLRSAPPISNWQGYQYKNLLDKETTDHVLANLKPRLIFSGDDHDQCSYAHTTQTIEHTVGTFSWMQGNLIPSFGMLSLRKQTSGEVQMTFAVCFLPNQLHIYFFYIFLLLASLALYFAICCVSVQNLRGSRLHGLPLHALEARKNSITVGSYSFSTRVPRRDDAIAMAFTSLRLLLFYVSLQILEEILNRL